MSDFESERENVKLQFVQESEMDEICAQGIQEVELGPLDVVIFSIADARLYMRFVEDSELRANVKEMLGQILFAMAPGSVLLLPPGMRLDTIVRKKSGAGYMDVELSEEVVGDERVDPVCASEEHAPDEFPDMF